MLSEATSSAAIGMHVGRVAGASRYMHAATTIKRRERPTQRIYRTDRARKRPLTGVELSVTPVVSLAPRPRAAAAVAPPARRLTPGPTFVESSGKTGR